MILINLAHATAWLTAGAGLYILRERPDAVIGGIFVGLGLVWAHWAGAAAGRRGA